MKLYIFNLMYHMENIVKKNTAEGVRAADIVRIYIEEDRVVIEVEFKDGIRKYMKRGTSSIESVVSELGLNQEQIKKCNCCDPIFVTKKKEKVIYVESEPSWDRFDL